MAITLLVTVLCSASPLTTQLVETTKAQYETDLQLIRRGWYQASSNGRCKAVRVQFKKEKRR